MSMKLVTRIKDIKGIPGKYKRVLEAWAAFANHDGTNIFASKESVASKAGISKWTVFRNTDDLIAASVLIEAKSHICSTEECDKGAWHYAGNGHYTRAYNIGVAELQNATQLVAKLSSKMLLGQGSKMPKSKVAKSHATQSFKETQSDEPTRSVLTDGQGRNEGTKEDDIRCAHVVSESVSPQTTNSDPRSDGQDDKTTNLYWYLNVADLAYAFDDDGQVIPHEVRHGTIEELYDVVSLWFDLVGTYDESPTVMEAIASCFHHVADHDTLLESMRVMVKEHPKLSKIAWRDLTIGEGPNKGKGFLDKFEYNKRQVDGWRRGLEAQRGAKARLNAPMHTEPLWLTKQIGGGETMREIGRKPRTREERRELLDLSNQPKKNKEYILGFLNQDNCSNCHGQNLECECRYTEEVMGLEAKQGNPSARTNGSAPAPPPIAATPPPPEPFLCVHGWNPKEGQCWECLHPPNRKCAGCSKMFWVQDERTQPFCANECAEAHHQKTQDRMVQGGLAQASGTKDPLVAFLDGEA